MTLVYPKQPLLAEADLGEVAADSLRAAALKDFESRVRSNKLVKTGAPNAPLRGTLWDKRKKFLADMEWQGQVRF